MTKVLDCVNKAQNAGSAAMQIGLGEGLRTPAKMFIKQFSAKFHVGVSINPCEYFLKENKKVDVEVAYGATKLAKLMKHITLGPKGSITNILHKQLCLKFHEHLQARTI
jgi:hypothetical protein